MGSDVAGGQTPLYYAAKFGIHFAARKLLDMGTDVFVRDEEGIRLWIWYANRSKLFMSLTSSPLKAGSGHDGYSEVIGICHCGKTSGNPN